MLNPKRRQQFLDLMAESGWDLLLLYGHSWRKDYFRSLVNFNFFGPHALAALSRSGDISIVVSHPWDHEHLANSAAADIRWTSDFGHGVEGLLASYGNARVAIAGIEL